jgi:hypothetical protein
LLVSLIYLIFATLYISAFWKAEADTIQFRPKHALFQSDFWLGKRGTTGRNWLFKYPLSCFWDGWHFCITMMLESFFLLIGTLFIYITHISYYYIIVFAILGNGIFGLFFNLEYDDNLTDMI